MLLWVLSWDVIRFRSLVVFTGISYLVAAPVFFAIDSVSGMPWFWTIGDAGSCLGFGAALLCLVWWDFKPARKGGAQGGSQIR